MVSIFLIGIALAMDAFAVSISCGVIIPKLKLENAFKIAFFFGFFQAAMPVIGWLVGAGMKNYIQPVDHYIAFGLLGFIGVRMIYEAVKNPEFTRLINPLMFSVLIILSIATSIDALAVGLSFAFLEVSIISAIIIIGTVTFILSFFAVLFGDRVGYYLKKKPQIIGGLILIGIGIKIMIEHLYKGI